MSVDRRFRTARIWSNNELRRIGHLFVGDIVNVSAGDDVDKEGGTYGSYFPNKNGWYMTNYQPGSFRGFQARENEFLVDLVETLPDNLDHRFDVVFNHTTLEHIFNVEKAFANICAMSRDVVIVVVPFCQVQHETSSFADFWRFTPSCLRELFRQNQLEVIYESESPDIDAAIYLFFVASRNPEKWRSGLPPFTRIENCGEWIGRKHRRNWLRLFRIFR